VVWTVGSLSILAIGLGAYCASTLGLTERLERRFQARSIVQAAVAQALEVLGTDPTPASNGLNEAWCNNPEAFSQRSFDVGSFTIHYNEKDPATRRPKEYFGLVDEERKLNLNTAPADVLQNLLKQAERLNVIKESDIDTVVDSILDWRDEDKEKRPYGAENFYYLGLSQPYECKDGPFQNIEELLFVRGVTPELFAWMTPYVTVYGLGKINLNTANEVVLKALGLSDAGVQGVVFYRAGEDNIEGTGDDRILNSVSSALVELSTYCPKEDLKRLTKLDSEGLLTVRSQEFQILITAQVANDPKSRIVVRCVVNRSGTIKMWSEQ